MKQLLIFLLSCSLLYPSLYGMEFDTDMLTTAVVVSEMCYGMGIDLKTPKIPDPSGPRATMMGDDHDSHNFGFLVKELKMYPDGYASLRSIWNNVVLQRCYEKYPHGVNIISILSPDSKKKLLKRLKYYEPSNLELFAYSTVSFMGMLAVGYAAKVGFKRETDTPTRLYYGALGLCVLYGALHSLKGLYGSYQKRSWWQQCPNFHQAIKMCQNENEG